MNNTNLGGRISDLLQKNGLTQRELAEKMHQIICKHEAENWAKPQKNDEQQLIGFDFGEGRDSAIIELWGHKYQITRID